MTAPLIIRVVRPYRTVDEYLDAEGSTIDKRGMLLVGAAPVEAGTVIRFMVSLESGEPLLKAEGEVRRHVEPQPGCRGGLQVRFKRFGASTKEFLERAATHRRGPLGPTELDSSPLSARKPEVPDRSSPRAVAEPRRGTSEPCPSPASRPSVPADREALLARLRTRALALTPALLAGLKRKVG